MEATHEEKSDRYVLMTYTRTHTCTHIHTHNEFKMYNAYNACTRVYRACAHTRSTNTKHHTNTIQFVCVCIELDRIQAA